MPRDGRLGTPPCWPTTGPSTTRRSSSEAARRPSSCAAAGSGRGRKRLETDGAPLEGVEIRLDPGTGEIHSRGPDCFLSYTDPKLTASVFDVDGWCRTGDVGVLDDDG